MFTKRKRNQGHSKAYIYTVRFGVITFFQVYKFIFLLSPFKNIFLALNNAQNLTTVPLKMNNCFLSHDETDHQSKKSTFKNNS